MGDSGDASASLSIFAFLNPDKKRKNPKFLKMYWIQASEVYVDNHGRLMNIMKKKA